MKKLILILLITSFGFSFGQRKSLAVKAPKDKYENVYYKKSGHTPTVIELEVDVSRVSFTISHDEKKSKPVYVIGVFGKSKNPKHNFSSFMFYPKSLEEFMYFKEAILESNFSRLNLDDNRYKSGGKNYDIKSMTLVY